jgi:hypothetical protein
MSAAAEEHYRDFSMEESAFLQHVEYAPSSRSVFLSVWQASFRFFEELATLAEHSPQISCRKSLHRRVFPHGLRLARRSLIKPSSRGVVSGRSPDLEDRTRIDSGVR